MGSESEGRAEYPRRQFLPTSLLLCALTLAFGIFLSGCSMPPSRVEFASAVDAIVLSREQALLFNFGRRAVQRWTRAALHDPSAPRPPLPEKWETLHAPRTSEPFQPLAVTAGPAGNLYLLDGGSRRIWQYDTTISPVTSLALPADLENAALAQAVLSWDRRDGLVLLLPRERRAFFLREAFGSLAIVRETRILREAGSPLACFTSDRAFCLWSAGWLGGPDASGNSRSEASHALIPTDSLAFFRGDDGEPGVRFNSPLASLDPTLQTRSLCFVPRNKSLNSCPEN